MEFSDAKLKRINEGLSRDFEAQVRQSAVSPKPTILVQTFDLSVAQSRNNPYCLSFPFTGFLVRSASDSTANINFLFDDRGISNDGAVVKLNSCFETKHPLANGFFWWAAQGTGKQVIIEFYRDSFINPGNYVSSISMTYSGAPIPEAKATTTATPASLLALNLDRKRLIIQNQGGIDIYVGGTVGVTIDTGANPGMRISPGQSLVWDSTSAVFAVSNGTNANVAMQIFT